MKGKLAKILTLGLSSMALFSCSLVQASNVLLVRGINERMAAVVDDFLYSGRRVEDADSYRVTITNLAEETRACIFHSGWIYHFGDKEPEVFDYTDRDKETMLASGESVSVRMSPTEDSNTCLRVNNVEIVITFNVD